MNKVYFEQVFRRVKPGGYIQDTTIRFEVAHTNENQGECVRKAWKLLKDSPGLRFRSGWTGWMLKESRFVDEKLEELEVNEYKRVAGGNDESVSNVEVPAEEPIVITEPLPEAEEIFEPVDTMELPEVIEPEEPEVKEPETVAPHIRGDAIERLKKYSRWKIKNIYDDPDFPHDAIEILQPDFEYADWKEERVAQLWKR